MLLILIHRKAFYLKWCYKHNMYNPHFLQYP